MVDFRVTPAAMQVNAMSRPVALLQSSPWLATKGGQRSRAQTFAGPCKGEINSGAALAMASICATPTVRWLSHRVRKSEGARRRTRRNAAVATDTPRGSTCDCEHILQTIVEVPDLLSAQECRVIVEAAERRAADIGWGAARHLHYVTEDVKVSSLGDESAIKLFETRVAEPLQSIIADRFHLPQGSVRVNDAFVVRYDADGQTELSLHRDGSIVSATVSLSRSNEYAGGGTCIDNKSYRPEQGGAVVFAGARMHGGSRVTAGSRYIVTIFFRCDELDLCECHYLTWDQETLWEGAPVTMAHVGAVGALGAVALAEWQLYEKLLSA